MEGSESGSELVTYGRIRMRIREAQKHTDPDADPDPQHWLQPVFLFIY
jgi:hypothetical protein